MLEEFGTLLVQSSCDCGLGVGLRPHSALWMLLLEYGVLWPLVWAIQSLYYQKWDLCSTTRLKIKQSFQWVLDPARVVPCSHGQQGMVLGTSCIALVWSSWDKTSTSMFEAMDGCQKIADCPLLAEGWAPVSSKGVQVSWFLAHKWHEYGARNGQHSLINIFVIACHSLNQMEKELPCFCQHVSYTSYSAVFIVSQ